MRFRSSIPLACKVTDGIWQNGYGYSLYGLESITGAQEVAEKMTIENC